MPPIRSWLRQHKFETHVVAFIMMVIPPVGLYFAAQQADNLIIWVLLSVIILANFLVILVP